MILACSCRHEVQDVLHGRGRRVMNRAPKAFNGVGGWRCSVCDKLSQPPVKKEVKSEKPVVATASNVSAS